MTDESGSFSVHLGRVLQQARRAVGLTQAEVVDHLGRAWTVSKLGTYERGERNITVERLGHLVFLYGLDARTLIADALVAVDWTPPEVPHDPVGDGRSVVVDLVRARSLAPDLPIGRFAAVAGPGLTRVRLDENQLSALAQLHGTSVDEVVRLVAPRVSERNANGSGAPGPVGPGPS